MLFQSTSIEGLFEIHLAAREDARGYFMRTYDVGLFEKNGLQTEWVQENQSLSVEVGTIRGLHFQRPPFSETKLVRALAGRILDVAVDLREGSETFGKFHAVELSALNRKCLYIPKGFAHGFYTFEPNSILAYKVDQVYSPQAEGGLIWNDKAVGIEWPSEPTIMSDKDRILPSLAEIEPLQLAMLEGVK
jgi:dTDP-4-dehydrorhamnose 3,5-epimerase